MLRRGALPTRRDGLHADDMAGDEQLQPMLSSSGQPFDPSAVELFAQRLASLDDASRRAYRNQNATSIAASTLSRLLIVAGPGTGKSHLFLARIRHWLAAFPGERIYVTSFVRKLVGDLSTDIRNSHLQQAEKQLVSVTTLHGLARSLIERNGGSSTHQLGQHVRMIGPAWKDMVWTDVLAFHPPVPGVSLADFERQFFDAAFREESPWPELTSTYIRLTQYYNAVGFADSIWHATCAVRENATLVEHSLWIVDEFQDFNLAEAALLETLTEGASAVLLAGDDDQALYGQLKSSHPEIIQTYYADVSWAKAMLPLCGRCDADIARGAEAFIAAERSASSIDKVFLPLVADETCSPIQVVICPNPAGAVSYVGSFIADHRDALLQRKHDIEDGRAKDPYLLVLSYSKQLNYFPLREADALRALVDEWRVETAGPGADYVRVTIYYGSARYPLANFPLRKVLELEAVSLTEVHRLLEQGLGDGHSLSEMDSLAVRESAAKCRRVHDIVVAPDRTAEERAAALSEIIRVADPARLAADLEAFPLGGAPSDDDDQEHVEGPGRVSPVELMSIVGSKGLSADHVVILGCDQVNLSPASPLAFYVAMTRARKTLHLLTAVGAGGAQRPHRYVAGLPQDCCHYLKILKSGVEEIDDRASFLRYCDRLSAARQRKR